MVRIRIKGYSIGQINESLIGDYIKKHCEKDVVSAASKIIVRQFAPERSEYLSPTIEELVVVEEGLKQYGYRNIGEYIQEYIRHDLFGDLFEKSLPSILESVESPY